MKKSRYEQCNISQKQPSLFVEQSSRNLNNPVGLPERYFYWSWRQVAPLVIRVVDIVFVSSFSDHRTCLDSYRVSRILQW